MDGTRMACVQPIEGATGAGVEPVKVASPGTTQFASAALEAAHVVKATPGDLYDFFVYNSSPGVLYLHLYDRVDAPGLGATPAVRIGEVAGTTTASLTGHRISGAVGLVLALSSTQTTYTSPGAVGSFCGWRS